MLWALKWALNVVFPRHAKSIKSKKFERYVWHPSFDKKNWHILFNPKLSRATLKNKMAASLRTSTSPFPSFNRPANTDACVSFCLRAYIWRAARKNVAVDVLHLLRGCWATWAGSMQVDAPQRQRSQPTVVSAEWPSGRRTDPSVVVWEL